MQAFVGGVVRDAARTWEALAVDAGVIVARGPQAKALARGGATVVDLQGGCLIPGFRDGHLHPLHGGMELLGPPITGATSIEDIGERLRRYAGEHPDEQVIVAGSYSPPLAPGGRFMAAWLDRFVADRPVVLTSSDHHAAWVNSAALAAVGITAATPDPPRGTILRDESGEPIGTLLETAMALVDDLVVPDVVAQGRGLQRALEELARCGIVWGQEASLGVDEVQVYLDAAERDELTCRFDLALRVEPDGWRRQVANFVHARGEIDRRGRGLLSANCVKFFVDGVIEAGTGALLEPYVDGLGVSGRPGDTGTFNWEPSELTAAVTTLDEVGFTPHLHAIGDAGIRAALDAIAHMQSVNPPRDRRPVIAHTQLVDPVDLPRFAALGVIANFEPFWAKASPMNLELTNPRLGPERADRQYQMASLARSGARISFGSDWPVTSLAPPDGLRVAITRQTADGVPPGGWTPQERLSPELALAAYTSGSAYQAFDPHASDLLAPGAPADLCWLSADPCDPALDFDPNPNPDPAPAPAAPGPRPATNPDPRSVAASLRSLTVRGTWFAGRPLL